jgi:hypothetical protein
MGYNRVGVFSHHLKKETGPVSETLCFIVIQNSGWWTKCTDQVSWVELMLWWTVSRPIRLGIGHPFGAHRFLFFLTFCRTIASLFVLRRPLWREDGSVICSAICHCSESQRTHNHILLSHLRLLSSLFVASYDSQYSNTHGEDQVIQCYTPFSEPFRFFL